MITQPWNQPVTITENNFIYKSLSNWACNVAVGCEHACRFCYVPSASTIKLGPALKKLGVNDPDEQWGEYVFPRRWDEKAFMASLRKAEATPNASLKPDGNRAVMFCSTTDPYQVISDRSMELPTREALRAILECSTLNVRILTRSPLARRDFDLMKQFGDRLIFGMSLPTLDNKLARIYEPKAPAPSKRLDTLKRAKDAGLAIYVAMAPTYPECDDANLAETLHAIADLELLTVFHEPINIRAENIHRIEAHAATLGMKMKTEVFTSTERWASYAIEQLKLVETIAQSIGLGSRLHLWPDKSLKKWANEDWLNEYWLRISEWPGKVVAA